MLKLTFGNGLNVRDAAVLNPGVPNAQVASPVLYLFFGIFFLPGDLNEVWQAAGGGQLPA